MFFFDANQDGEIEVTEVANVATLLLQNSNISDLTGIEHFTNLFSLDCSGNQLTHLDLTAFSALHILRLSNNQLVSLEVHGLQHLYSLLCDNNQLTKLNVSGLPTLDMLNLDHNLLTAFDASPATHLRLLNCNYNQLASINITGLSYLRHIRCTNNALTTIDLSGTANLWTLDCNNNFLDNLDVSQLEQLNHFDCFTNQMTTIDVSHCPNLHSMDCSFNQLETVNIKNGTYFDVLDVSANFNLGQICANESDINGNLIIFGFEPTMYLTSDCDLSTSHFASNSFTAYPNPTHDVLNVDTKERIIAAKIYNAMEQLVLTIPHAVQNINVAALQAGHYLLRIETGKSSATLKFCKI